MYANPVDNIQAYSEQVVPDMNNVVAPEIMNSNVVDNIQAYDENIIPDNMQNNNEIQSSEEMLQENPVESIQAYDELILKMIHQIVKTHRQIMKKKNTQKKTLLAILMMRMKIASFDY